MTDASAFHDALNRHRQIVIDMDGDGVPDAVYDPQSGTVEGALRQPPNNTSGLPQIPGAPNTPADQFQRDSYGLQPRAAAPGEAVFEPQKRPEDALASVAQTIHDVGPGAAMHAGKMMGEGASQISRGEYGRGAGNMAMGALSTPVPLLAPIARGMGQALTAAPRTTASAAGGAAFATPSMAGDTDFDAKMLDLNTQRSQADARTVELERTLQGLIDDHSAAVAEADAEGKSGRGNRWRKKNARAEQLGGVVRQWKATNASALDGARARSKALQAQIDRLVSTESPEANRERARTTPINELYPDETFMAQMGVAGAGLGMAALNRGRGLVSRNRAAKRTEVDANAAITQARELRDAGNITGAATQLDEAVALTQPSAIPGIPRDAMGTYVPAIAGFEAAALGPTGIDYIRSGGDPNSPLYKKAIQSMTGDTAGLFPGSDVAARSAMAGLLGVAGTKLTNAGAQAAVGLHQPYLPTAKVNALTNELTGAQAVSPATMANQITSGVKADARASKALQSQHMSAQAQQHSAALAGVRRQGELDALQTLKGPKRLQAVREMEASYSPSLRQNPNSQQLPVSGQNPSGALQPPNLIENLSPNYTADHTMAARVHLDQMLSAAGRSGAPTQRELRDGLEALFKRADLAPVPPDELMLRIEGTLAASGNISSMLRPANRQITNPAHRDEVLNLITGHPGTLAVPAAVGGSALSGLLAEPSRTTHEKNNPSLPGLLGNY